MEVSRAGVHFRTERPEAVLAFIRGEVETRRALSPKSEGFLDIMRTVSQEEIAHMTDLSERARATVEMAAGLEDLKEYLVRGEPAAAVIRPGFVSLYWPDHFYAEDLEQDLRAYAVKTGVPVLGTAVRDAGDLRLCAVVECGGVMDDRRFQEADETDIDGLCRLLRWQGMAPALERVFFARSGAEQILRFEAQTGLQVFLDAAGCEVAGFPVRQVWDNGTVFGT